MTSFYSWSTTPGDNATADSNINFAEQQLPGTVNNSARQVMGRLAEWHKDMAPLRVSSGSGNLYTVTIQSAPGQYINGMRVTFRADKPNTDAATINVNSYGIKPLRRVSGEDLDAGEIQAGYVVDGVYLASSDEVIMTAPGMRGLTDDDIPALLDDYVDSNVDAIRNSLWIMRPIASATTTAAPSGATDGTLYLVPSGASGSTWASNIGKIAEASGGSWNYHTPAEGWSVLAKDADTVYVYDTSWNAISAASNGTDYLQSATFKHVLSTGTNGGNATTGWNERTLNTTVNNTISGASLSSNAMGPIPAGRWLVTFSATVYAGSSGAKTQIKLAGSTTTILGKVIGAMPSGSVQPQYEQSHSEIINLASDETFKLYTYHSGNVTDGWGRATSAGGDEVFASVTWISLEPAQGPQGDDGDPGADGAGYLASSSTSNSIGTGSKTWTTSSGLAYRAGDFVQVADTAAPSTNYCRGTVTSYSSTSLVVSVTETGGSGTKTAWTISLCGASGTAGDDGAGYGGTSTTSLAIGTGSKTLTTQAGLAYVVGARIRLANSASNWMEGTITDYTGTSLTFTSDKTSGSGTLTSWTLAIAGVPGADGAGSGTVTDVAASGGIETVSGSTITASGEVRGTHLINAQTGTTYTFVAGDRGKVVTFSNASSVAVTLAQAQSSTASAIGYTGWHCFVLNKGAGAVTITPTTSTIGGSSTLVLAQHEGALISSDGTNYQRLYMTSSGSISLYSLITALTAETAPSISDNIAIDDVSAAAGRKMTLGDMLKVINGLTAETTPAADDVLALYDTSASTTDKITVENFFKAIAQITALTSVDVADSIPIYDASATSAKSATLTNVFAAVNGLIEDTSPAQSADYTLTYDTSATTAKKVLLSKVGTGKIAIPIDASQFNGLGGGTKTTVSTATITRTYLNLGGSAGGTASTYGIAEIKIPKGYSVATFTAVIEWSYLTAEASGTDVIFTIEAAATSDGDAFPTSFGTAISVTDTGTGENKTHFTSEFSAITPSGSPAAEDSIWIRLGRDAANGSDTLGQLARVHSVMCFFTSTANTAD